MTINLRDALREIADGAPPPAVPSGLYDRARRTRRRRQAFAATAALAVLAVMILGLYALPDRWPAQPATPAPTPAGLPSRVVKAPRYTGDVAKHPVGPATVVYDGGEQTHTEPLVFGNDDYPLVVVGSADQYRLLHRPEWSGAIPGSSLFLLSPNGRYCLMENGSTGPLWESQLVDLSTGSVTRVTAGVQLAWSPDSRFAVFANFKIDGGAAATLQVADLPSGTVTLRAPIAAREGYGGNLTAAVSPDGTAIAVLDGSDLHVYRQIGNRWLATTVAYNTDWTTQRLAGPAAWTPDGTEVVVLDSSGALTRLDAKTGQVVGGPALPPVGPQPVNDVGTKVIGWRDGAPIVTSGNRVTLLSQPARTLITAPKGAIDLQVATDRLTLPIRQPGPPQAGSLIQRYGHLILSLAIVVSILLPLIALYRVLWRWTRIALRR